MKDACFQCGNQGQSFYGYTICDSCKTNLRLFTDKKIKQYITLFDTSAKKQPYKDEIKYKLDFIEKDYIKKKIILSHILDRIEQL